MSAILLSPDFGKTDGITTERHSQVGRKGDLTIELHFGDFSPGFKRKEAALFIYGRDRARGAYVPLSQMWRYAEKDALHALAIPLAEQVYGFPTRDDAIRILDSVLDYLQDLKDSPLPPRGRCRSLDQFLADVEETTEGGHFFAEINGKRVVG